MTTSASPAACQNPNDVFGIAPPVQTRVYGDDAIRIDPDAFYTERAAAATLRMSLQTVRRHRRQSSALPFTRYGRGVYYLGADIIALLKGGRQRSTSDARA